MRSLQGILLNAMTFLSCMRLEASPQRMSINRILHTPPLLTVWDRLALEVPGIEIVERVEDAVSTALLATPPDGQIVITGSLYVVGAARSVLVS